MTVRIFISIISLYIFILKLILNKLQTLICSTYAVSAFISLYLQLAIAIY